MNANSPTPTRDQSMFWGHEIDFWDLWGIRLMFAGAGLGVVALFVSLASAYLLYRVADTAQSDLKTKTQGLEAVVATARADLGKANTEIARANERAKALEAEAAKARLEQDRLKAHLAWRRLTKEQHDKIVAEMRGKPKDFEVDFPMGDAEAGTLANDIITALRDAGLEFGGTGANAVVWMPTPPFGLIVRQKTGRDVVHPVALALTQAGFDVKVETDSSNAQLIVGSRPSPF